jgi:hypothetical protein
MQIRTKLRLTSVLLEWQSSRKQTTTNAGEDGGRRKEPSYTVGGNVN